MILQKNARRRIGIIEVLLSGVCFGFLGIFGKALYAKGVTPGELLSLRFLIGGSMIGAYLIIRRPSSLKLPIRSLSTCAALGVFGYAVFSSCFFQALSGLSASLTVLLLYLYPVMVAVGAWILLGEKISRDRLIVFPASMLGLALLVWGEIYVKDPMALVFGIGAAFFYSFYIISSSRLLRDIDPYVSVTFIQLFAGLALAIVHWHEPSRISDVIISNWPILLTLALVCSVAAMGLFLAGLQKLQSWEVSILSTAEPVTAILLAIFLLDESLSSLQMIGGSIVLGTFVFLSIPSRK